MMSSASVDPSSSNARVSNGGTAAVFSRKAQAAAAGPAPPPGPNDLIGIHIPEWQVIDEVQFFHITCVTPVRAWSCSKRYSQFEQLHLELIQQFPSLSLPAGAQLPPKKPRVLLSTSDIEERRILLEHYSRRMNTVKEVAKSSSFLTFFSSDALDALIPVPDEPLVNFPDAEITAVSIPMTRQMTDHTLFHLELSNSHLDPAYSDWSVLKRFLQFHELDTLIRADFADQPYFLSTLPCPPSRQLKLVVDHKDIHFIEHRRLLLEVWMKKIITIPQVAKNLHFLRFCGVNTGH